MQVSDEQHLDAVIAFSESWRANMALPEDERMGVAVGAALAVLPEPTAELEEARAGLEACRERRDELEQTCESQDEELAQLRERHEALRAELEACKRAHDRADTELHWLDDQVFQNVYANPGEKLREMIKAIRDLLKPAPAEADPVIARFRANPPLMEPVQPPSPESKRPASLREVWAAIDGLRESLETAWEVNGLHEALLRALRNAVVMTPIEQRDLDPVLHAMDAIDARWRERGRK